MWVVADIDLLVATEVVCSFLLRPVPLTLSPRRAGIVLHQCREIPCPAAVGRGGKVASSLVHARTRGLLPAAAQRGRTSWNLWTTLRRCAVRKKGKGRSRRSRSRMGRFGRKGREREGG
eukprot:754752-Hanusia_phi.AAC.3